MDLLEHSIVKGTIDRPALTPLSVLDLLTGHVNTGGMYFFRRTPDIPKLKSSLAKTLDSHRHFGGSLVQNDGKFYLCSDNTGVFFSVVQSESRCPEFHAPHSIADRRNLLDADISCQELINTGVPLNSFKLILFRDGSSALGISTTHSVADGASVSNFMRCWSMLYCGLTPPAVKLHSRDIIDNLALGDGYKPSAKLTIVPPLNFDVGKKIVERKPSCGAVDVYIPASALTQAVQRCRSSGASTLSSSDVIHAMAWQAFARSTSFCGMETAKLFTIFDIRRVEELGIPSNYDGNALLERSAKAPFSDIRNMDLQEVATTYRDQVKPLSPMHIRQDIAFLKREYEHGNVHPQWGKFTNFARACVVDCLDGTGVYVNDMRHLEANKTAFEDETVWYETVVNLGFNTIFIYQKDHDKLHFRYTGSNATLDAFEHHLHEIVFNDCLQDERPFMTTAYG